MLRSALAIPALLALLAAGCGEDSKESGGGGAPAKAQYIERADAICQGAEREGRALEARFAALRGRDPAAVRREAPPLLREIAAFGRRLLTRLRAIPIPAEDRAAAVAYFAEVQRGVQRLERYGQAIADGNSARVQALGGEIPRGTQTTQRLAREYGFKECSSGD